MRHKRAHTTRYRSHKKSKIIKLTEETSKGGWLPGAAEERQMPRELFRGLASQLSKMDENITGL